MTTQRNALQPAYESIVKAYQRLDMPTDAAENTLIDIRIVLDTWSKRQQPTISQREWEILNYDFRSVLAALDEEGLAESAQLIRQAHRIVATTAAQPFGRELVAAG